MSKRNVLMLVAILAIMTSNLMGSDKADEFEIGSAYIVILFQNDVTDKDIQKLVSKYEKYDFKVNRKLSHYPLIQMFYFKDWDANAEYLLEQVKKEDIVIKANALKRVDYDPIKK